MERHTLTRTSKPQRPTLQEYIRGEAKLEDLVPKNRIVIADPHRASSRAVVATASINAISRNSSYNKSQPRKADQMSSAVKQVHNHHQAPFSSESSSNKSRPKTETKDDKRSREPPLNIALSSSSLGASERSAQGDMTESKVSRVRTLSSSSTRTSVIVDRALIEKEAEIKNLKRQLEELLEDLPSNDVPLSESSDNAHIVERLRNAVRTLRESHEKYLQLNVEKEEKLAQVSVNNDLQNKCIEKLLSDLEKVNKVNKEQNDQLTSLQTQNERLRENLESSKREHTSGKEMCGALEVSIQDDLQNKRIEKLLSDLEKVTEVNREQNGQLTSLQTQNERLRENLESSKRVHTSGKEMCGALEVSIQDKLENKADESQNIDTVLQERVNEVEREFGKLDTVCRQHINSLEQVSREQIEELQAKLREMEMEGVERMQQVSEVTALYDECEKQKDELSKTNKELEEKVEYYTTLLITLRNENLSLKSFCRYLQRRNKALEGICGKKIDSLSSPLKQETLAKLSQESLDAERAYSKDLYEQINETLRVTRGSNDDRQ